MNDQPRIDVICNEESGGWLASVTVHGRTSSTSHDVRVSAADRARLAPGAPIESLLTASFEFLLEREPKESILREFDINVIGRYFPEYEQEIKRRLRS
jgi:hypothetical protein